MTAISTVPAPNRADVVLAALSMLTRNIEPGTTPLATLKSSLAAVYAANTLSDDLIRDFRPAMINESLPHVIAYLNENNLITQKRSLTPAAYDRLALHPATKSGVYAVLSSPRR